jgi:hypothetical protein
MRCRLCLGSASEKRGNFGFQTLDFKSNEKIWAFSGEKKAEARTLEAEKQNVVTGISH